MCSQEGFLQNKAFPQFRFGIGTVQSRIKALFELVHQNVKAKKGSVSVPVMIRPIEVPAAQIRVPGQKRSQIQRLDFLFLKHLEQIGSRLILIIAEGFRKQFSFQILLYRSENKAHRDIHGIQEIVKLSDRPGECRLQSFIRFFRESLAAIVQHSVCHDHGLVVGMTAGHPRKESVEVNKAASQPQS